MADPGVPRDVALAIADDLADDLTREIGGCWRVEVDQETLPLGPDGDIRLTQHAPRLLHQHNWDFVLYLTDLATHPDGHPLLYDVSGSTAAALVCVPVLGVLRVRSKVRKLALQLVRSGVGSNGLGAPGTEKLPPAQRRGFLSRGRLLGGMVLNNRPRRLMTALSGVVAAGAGTGAFGIFYNSIWVMADRLSAFRLTAIAILAVLAMVGWLIVSNRLWDTPARERLASVVLLYNLSTVVTLVLCVTALYLLLVAAIVACAGVVIAPDYMTETLGREAGPGAYLRIAWLSAAMGVVAGGLGSSFDSETDLRRITHGQRERSRMYTRDR